MSISGNMIGMYSQLGKTFVFEDEQGNELTGVVVDQPVVFTAGDNDVREGIVYAGDEGVSTGKKFIPPYYVRYGHKFVLAGEEATIVCPDYDYQSLMVTITTYNTSWEASTTLTYVSIDNGLYAVANGTKASDIVIDHDNEQINLGVTVGEKSVLRYFVVREDV